MPDLNLTKLREIAEAATPGPWEAEFAAKRKCTALNCDFDHWYNLVHVEGVALFKDSVLAAEDALHIATFDPTTVLALIDEIERLQRWKREAKQVFRGLGDLVEVADVPLGHSIIKGAIDCIEELRKEIDSLQPTKEEA